MNNFFSQYLQLYILTKLCEDLDSFGFILIQFCEIFDSFGFIFDLFLILIVMLYLIYSSFKFDTLLTFSHIFFSFKMIYISTFIKC